jgi:predicted site-specific integrase-resolvase
MHKEPDLIQAPEACLILGGVHRSTLTRLVQSGRIRPRIKLAGPKGAELFDRADVERLARERAA